MEMHQIRYFLAVAETLNFTRAAELCNVSQPALSRAVQQLEEEVGGLLFRRERNQTHLTDLGLLLRPRLQSVLENTREAKQAAQRFLTLDEAHVTLGVMCTIGPRRFMGLLADFQARHPGIELRLIEGVPDTLGERLATGELDLAIMAHAPAAAAASNSCWPSRPAIASSR
jgi:LysR family hydrogen peroxide-inducible transcriptional activator